MIEVIAGPVLLGALSLMGWTGRELYRTSKNQTALEQRVSTNEKEINRLFNKV